MRKSLSACASLPLLFLLVAACEAQTDDPGSGGVGGPGAPAPSPPPPGQAPPVVTCPKPTSGPTEHAGDVKDGEVWTAAASPHVLTANVRVRDGAKLVIEPCAEIQLAEGVYFQVAFPGTPNSGAVIAEGTAEQPIRFVGKDGARWASVSVYAGGVARFAHVTFEGGGGGDFQENATLALYGDGEDGTDEVAFVDHVTISGSLGVGARTIRGAAFVRGSRELTVRGSGSEESPWPLVIEEHAIDTLPTGSYTGNKRDEILLDPAGGQVSGSGLLADATLHYRGVPYRVGRSEGDNLLVGGRVDGKLVTLTIEPGVVLKFLPGTRLAIQRHTSDEPASAAIHAVGTPDEPIVFTSAAEAPAPGDWQGLWFGGIPDAKNRIEHARIEYAGYDCSCVLNTCSAITEHEGAVIFTGQPASAFIKNTVFRGVAGHGVTEGYDGSFVDFRPTNTFEGLSGCVQTRPRAVDSSCPNPRPACD